MQAINRMCRICSVLPQVLTSCSINTSPVIFGTSPQQFKQEQSAANKKGAMITKYISLANGAVKMNGGITDPAVNKNLAQVIEKASKEGISKTKILNAVTIKSDLKHEEMYFFTTSSGMAFLINCRSVSAIHGKNTLSSHLRKSMLKASFSETRLIEQYFERRGVIIVPQPLEDGTILSEDESTELALEIEAEEVSKVEDGLKFLCSSSSLKDVVATLEERNVPVSYSSIDFVPLSRCEISEDDLELYQLFLRLLQRKTTLSERQCEFHEVVNNIE